MPTPKQRSPPPERVLERIGKSKRPKSLNSYSYVNDNPICQIDPLERTAVDYRRPVEASAFLNNYTHAVPQSGENLPVILVLGKPPV
jgi:hypothetical protein